MLVVVVVVVAVVLVIILLIIIKVYKKEKKMEYQRKCTRQQWLICPYINLRRIKLILKKK